MPGSGTLDVGKETKGTGEVEELRPEEAVERARGGGVEGRLENVGGVEREVEGSLENGSDAGETGTDSETPVARLLGFFLEGGGVVCTKMLLAVDIMVPVIST